MLTSKTHLPCFQSAVYNACILFRPENHKILVRKFTRATLNSGVTQMQTEQHYAYDHNYGCRKFQVQLPRKALEIIKQRYGNIGALIRGLLAAELGEDWPANELYVKGPTNRIHHTQLSVIRSRNLKRTIKSKRRELN